MSINLTKSNYQIEIVESKLPIIIKASANWCGPCRQLDPVFHEIESEYQDKIKFVELNIERARDLAIKFGIRNIPALIFIKDGMVLGKKLGAVNKNTFLVFIDQFFSIKKDSFSEARPSSDFEMTDLEL